MDEKDLEVTQTENIVTVNLDIQEQSGETKEEASSPKGEQWEMPPVGPDHSEEKQAQDTEEKREQVWREEEARIRKEQEAYQKQETEITETEQKDSFLKRLFQYVAHLVRYAIDPMYRNDCRYVASIERRADLKTQAKDYEKRREAMQEKEKEPGLQKPMEMGESVKEAEKELPNTNAMINERMDHGMSRGEAIADLLNEKPDLSEYLSKRNLELAFQGALFQCNESHMKQFGLSPLQNREIMDLSQNLTLIDPSCDKMWKIVDQYYRIPDEKERTQFIGKTIQEIHAETRDWLGQALQSSMEKNGFSREQAIMAEVSMNPQLYLYLAPEDQTDLARKTAYDTMFSQTIDSAGRKDKWKGKSMEDQRFKDHIYRSMLVQYPQIAAPYTPQEVQRKLLPSIVIANPRAAVYLDPEIGRDRQVVYNLGKMIENENQRRQEKELPMIEKSQMLKQMEYYGQGAAGTLAEQMKSMWGLNPVQDMQEPVIQPKAEEQSIPVPEQIPEEVMEGIPYMEVPDDYQIEQSFPIDQAGPEMIPYTEMAGPSEAVWNPEEVLEPIEPEEGADSAEPENTPCPTEQEESLQQMPEDLPWYEQDSFTEAIAEAKQADAVKLYKSAFHEYDYEMIKKIVLEQNPELYKDLPEAERNIDATLIAVSQDISLMKYVPEDPCIEPEYGDRTEMRKAILSEIEKQALIEARETNVNVQYVIKNKYGKERAGDTLEVKDMKKEIRSRSFELQARAQEHDDYERN